MSAATSDRWAAALGRSHGYVTVAEVLSPSGAVLTTLDLTAGSVTITRDTAVRGACQVTCVGRPGLVPGMEVVGNDHVYGEDSRYRGLGGRYGADAIGILTGPLAPYVNELRLRRGVVYPDGSTELIGLGIYGFTAGVSITDDSGGLSISISGYDRSRLVSRNRWSRPYTIAPRTNVVAAIHALLLNRLGNIGGTFDFTTSPHTTGPGPLVFGLSGDSDPWTDAQELATAIGCELFVDGDGVFCLHRVPDPLDAPAVAELVEGDGGTLVRVVRSLSADATRNGVIVHGQGSYLGQPVRAEVWNMNPASPTARGGPFGDAPLVITSSLVSTPAQAQDMANARLALLIGADEVIAVDHVPNPAIQISDIVQVTRGASRVDARWIVEGLVIGMGSSDVQTTTLRRRRSLTQEST